MTVTGLWSVRHPLEYVCLDLYNICFAGTCLSQEKELL
jgi:hypothetical protein